MTRIRYTLAWWGGVLLCSAARGAHAQAAVAARTEPARASAASAAFAPAGRYALTFKPTEFETVTFAVTVADSAGRWTGRMIGMSGRSRPLLAVVPQPEQRQVVVQYIDGAGIATMLMRVAADDAVTGSIEYADGHWAITGKRTP